jgi:hypothetical protein
MTSPVGADQVAKKIVEQSLQEGTSKPQEANVTDQNRFQEAMQQQQVKPEQQTSVQQVETSAQPTQVTLPKTGGDSILQGIDKMRADVNSVGDKVASMAQGSLSPQEAAQAQMQLAEGTIKMQLIGQVPGKVEQDMDTLLKSS